MVHVLAATPIRLATGRWPRARLWSALILGWLVVSSVDSRAQGPYTVVRVPSPDSLDGALLSDLNNDLQGVGFGFDRDTRDRRAYFADERSARVLPVEYPESIVINNRGLIAGTRRLGPSEAAARVAFFAGAPAFDGYVEVPFPPELFLQAGRLTDNGILLLHGNSANPVSYAIYQLRLIPLSDFGIDVVVDVNELATLVGIDSSLRPVIRYLDGRTVIPWSGNGVVTAVGANGHYAGQSSYNVFWYGRPGEAASHLALGGRVVTPTRINRRGVVVGEYEPTGIGDRYAFMYQDGYFQNVNSLVSALVYFRHAVALTDQGVLAVHGGTFPAPDSGSVFATFLLIPQSVARPVVSYRVVGTYVTLTWSQVPGALEYIVEGGRGPGLADFYVASVGPLVLGVSGNVPPGRYYARVRARTALGLGPPSSEVIVDVP